MTGEAEANKEIARNRRQQILNAIGYYKYFVPYGLYKAGKKTKKKVKNLHAKYQKAKRILREHMNDP